MKPFSHILNIRDLGGISTEDNSIVKLHKLYRSASLGDATPSERERLAKELDICSVIDLRTAIERNSDPDPEIPGVENIIAPLIPAKTLGITFEDGNLSEMVRGVWSPDTFDICSVYRDMVDEAVSQSWQAIFRALLNSNGHAVLWHCTNGKDRTGIVAAAILLALGTPTDDVMADYLATNGELAERRRTIMAEAAARGEQPGFADKIGALMEARPEYLNAAFDAMDETYGSIGGFLEDICQISYAEDDQLRQLYLQ